MAGRRKQERGGAGSIAAGVTDAADRANLEGAEGETTEPSASPTKGAKAKARIAKPTPPELQAEERAETAVAATELTMVPPSADAAGQRDGDEKGLTGQLLIAMPSLASPDFTRTVIYLCAHTPEGAMGIVVNRPLESPSFDSLLKQLGVEPLPPVRRIRLGRGGPVDNARGFVLHTADWKGEGSLMVDEAVALTASLDILKAIADGGGPRAGFLALGYAGWGPGQLEREIQHNSWLSVPASLDVVFGDDAGSKWRRALALLNVDPSALATTAGHG